MYTQSYGAFSQSLHQRYFGERAPLEVSIEVTRRCPLECKHCYNNLPMGDLAARNRELSKEEHFQLLDQLVEVGAFWLLYSGGEIFARKDFLEIYTYAKQKGFLITLFTNGILINERIADYLLEFPPFAIEITLYGRTKKTYEALTGIPGSYERCLRGIELLRDRGLPLKLKTVPTTINYQGRLTDNTPSQTPVTGTVSMQFEIWDVASGGTASGLCEQSMRGLIWASNLNSSPRSSSAKRFMANTSCLLMVVGTVLSLSGRPRSRSNSMPRRQRS